MPAALIRIAVFLLAPLVWAQDTFENVARVVAFGDVHGDFERFTEILKQAQLTNKSNKWAGGKAHLVLCGDFVDRGPDSAKVMDLIINLEEQARKAGGKVHALIGNHEAMNLQGDWRYVPAADYASFRKRDSEQRRDAFLNAVLEDFKKNKSEPPDLEAFKQQFLTEHPPGWVERWLAFAPDGKYGKWLRTLNAIVKVNDSLFMHGGLSEKYAGLTLEEINTRLRMELSAPVAQPGGLATDPEGPLWFRGLSDGNETEITSLLVARILEQHKVQHIVLGHTPHTMIEPRYQGRVITIDVGISKAMGGQPAFLVIDKGQYSVVQQGRSTPLLQTVQ